MFEKFSVRGVLALAVLGVALLAIPVSGQEAKKKGGAVPLTFVPPPLENATYSIGIHDVKSGKLVRRLCEAAGQGTFKTGLNGLITSWDGKDDDGNALPPGKYAARGYAVGPLAVEGVAIHGNDWVQDDENLRICRVEGIGWVEADDGFCIVALMAGGGREAMRFAKGGKLVWHRPISSKELSQVRGPMNWRLVLVPDKEFVDLYHDGVPGIRLSFRLADGSAGPTPPDAPDPLFEKNMERGNDPEAPRRLAEGMGATVWAVNQRGLCQIASSGEVRRILPHEQDGPPDTSQGFKKIREWRPYAVSASNRAELLYLLEGEGDDLGAQRFRGISLKETKDENGKRISTWQTFVERVIRPPDPALGLEDAETAKAAAPAVEVGLEENPLSPGKHERARLVGTFDEKGSYLATADGLRLRQVGQRACLRAVKLTQDKTGGGLSFYQTDGAGWDEFSIKGVKKIVGFDAGEFEIDATGEKPVAEKAPEPDL